MKIIVTIEVDEHGVKESSGFENLSNAINSELGWLQGTGLSVTDWKFENEET